MGQLFLYSKFLKFKKNKKKKTEADT